jgi:hypothetical protein
LQLRIDGSNNGTYTHYANSAIYGDFAGSSARLTITNRYGYLVNNFDEYSAGHTYTNRWAFYNAGISDNNYFAGRTGVGAGYVPDAAYQFEVLGNVRFKIRPSVSGFQSITFTNSDVYNKIRSESYTQIESKFLLTIGADSGSNTYLGVNSLDQLTSIGIGYLGNQSISASAILDIKSTTKGLAVPRMTTTQKNAIASPVQSLIVFDTTLVKLCVYSGSSWETITSI